MDESSLRDLLRHATEAEPAMGPVAHNSLLAGIKRQRRRRAVSTVSFAAVAAVLAAGIPAVAHSLGHAPGPAAAVAQPQWLGRVAYVVSSYGLSSGSGSSADGSVTPFSLATNKPGKPIRVGVLPTAIAITPNGRTAYVVNSVGDTVTPITTADNMPGRAIRVGNGPDRIAITPDGKTAYVSDSNAGTVTPITTATNKPGKPIRVGTSPMNIVITPNGKTAYVETQYSVVPITTATNTAGRPVYTVPSSGNQESEHFPWDMAITPNGQNLYIAIANSDEVIPVMTAAGRAGKAINVGHEASAIAVAPNGKTVYVAGGNSGRVTPIVTATNTPAKAIKLPGRWPSAVAVTPNGKTVYVAAFGISANAPDMVLPIATATGTVGAPIRVGTDPTLLTQDGKTLYAVNRSSSTVTPITMSTGKAGAPIRVGVQPMGIAVAH